MSKIIWENKYQKVKTLMINITNNEIKTNLLEELITKKMEKSIEKELTEREPEPKKIKKVKIGKIKYATANSILENLTGFRKNKVKGLLRNNSFNEMRLIGN